MAVKRGLGKGLDSLIPESKTKVKTAVQNTGDIPAEGGIKDGITKMVDIGKIQNDKDQFRKTFNEDSIDELSENIKQHGIINPLIVQNRGDYYEIVAGERRWRAAIKAGLKEVPVIIREYTEQERAVIGLIDNIQRVDINPVEEALAYRKLIEEFGLTQDELSEMVSKGRSTITNSMRLLKLCEPVQEMIIDEKLSTGHARALIAVEDPDEQYRIAEQIFDEKLSVRDVEKLIKKLGKTKQKKTEKSVDKALKAIYDDIEENLKQKLNTKVSIIPSSKGNGAGKLEIEFYSHDELEKIMDILNKA